MIALDVSTLGCKLNQLDSAELAGALRAAGAQGAAGPARVIVVNTCTVTSAADADARQLLRRRRREHPGALLVATGCYAERDPAALRAMPEVDLVLMREDRPVAAQRVLAALAAKFPGALQDGCAERGAREALPDFGERTRAYLRVQEGCDLKCAYCIIPQVRGASRSVAAGQVEARFRALLEAGYREIVLTGVNTGDYGKDSGDGPDLAGLVRRLLGVDGEYRIRLNSVEPRCVTPGLIDLIGSEPRVAKHLQIPLQSGSDAVLAGMRRNYRVRHYAGLLESLRRRSDEIGLGADVIVGFPGEGEAQFEETLRFISGSPLNYLHVFSYSIRPGTDAARRPHHVPAPAIAARSRRLRDLGMELSRAFRRSLMGRPLSALALHGRRPDGRRRVLTSNFVEAGLVGECEENRFLDVRITRADPVETLASPA